MTLFELEILNALRIAGDDVSVAELISRSKIARARANVSSRLCELRTKDLCASRQHDGVNYWSLTAKGREVLGIETGNDLEAPNHPPDIADPEITEEPVTDQSVEVDISADISEGDLPQFADEYEYEPDGADDISPDPVLMTEAQQLRRPMEPFYDVQDALFVLNTLCMTYCDHLPAYQQEIGRIARYLQEAAA